MNRNLFLHCILLIILSGCARTLAPPAETASVEKIARQIPKWTFVGKISQARPNPLRVLMRHTGDMAEALQIMKDNARQYSENFYRSLPLGASLYISPDNDLFINKNGGPAPEETVTIYRTVNRCENAPPPAPPETGSRIMADDIVEETLTE